MLAWLDDSLPEQPEKRHGLACLFSFCFLIDLT